MSAASGVWATCAPAAETASATIAIAMSRIRLRMPTLLRARFLILDLRAVHQAARARIERVAPVHRAAVVPQHEITGAPVVPPGQRVARRMRPHVVQQRVALLEPQAFDLRVAPAPALPRSAPSPRLDRHHRV